MGSKSTAVGYLRKTIVDLESLAIIQEMRRQMQPQDINPGAELFAGISTVIAFSVSQNNSGGNAATFSVAIQDPAPVSYTHLQHGRDAVCADGPVARRIG